MELTLESLLAIAFVVFVIQLITGVFFSGRGGHDHSAQLARIEKKLDLLLKEQNIEIPQQTVYTGGSDVTQQAMYTMTADTPLQTAYTAEGRQIIVPAMVDDLLRVGNKIEAIKWYREFNNPTKMGLKEAKDAIEQYAKAKGYS